MGFDGGLQVAMAGKLRNLLGWKVCSGQANVGRAARVLAFIGTTARPFLLVPSCLFRWITPRSTSIRPQVRGRAAPARTAAGQQDPR
ncbi:hypothetical protein RA19_12605 [Leisingera sp. ANG-M1]|nr:hypothetical protein RA19_12605 [Leisingera sp. ANG-M1]